MKRKTLRYFAAANGYNGFKSYFRTIFDSREYERIFVIKGGPGTGKSSLMKKISAMLENDGCTVEEIYCSSDPKSLDGVIGYKNGKQIAVLDGTAPHERDAKIPGAIDEIINLGDGWDEKWLCSRKDRILKLSKSKGEAYSTAYYYLSICGHTQKEIFDQRSKLYDVKKINSEAKNLAEDIFSAENGITKIRLVSSFGRLGEYGFSTFSDNAEKIYSLRGDDTAKRIFMDRLSTALIDFNSNVIIAPDPLLPSSTEAIASLSGDACVTKDGDGEIIDLEKFLIANSPVLCERIKAAENIYGIAKTEAVRWFGIASEIHFELEGIYTQAMNFEKNDQIYEEMSDKIKNILI